MTIDACAALVERGDPDRFLAAMAAPPEARARLFPLYAFNLEVARAPWVTAEPLIAEMRLQWWRDVVAASESGAARAHEVAAPLHALIRAAGLPVAVLDALVAARRRDIDPEPWADEAALSAYLADTAGGLMWLSVRALGGADEGAARDAGWAMGLAAWFRAVPQLAARGRSPLPDDRPQAIAALAGQGLDRLARARAARPGAAAIPALRAGWQTGAILRLAQADPARVTQGALDRPEFARRGGLLWRALTGGW